MVAPAQAGAFLWECQCLKTSTRAAAPTDIKPKKYQKE